MLFIDESNKIRYFFNAVFQNNFCNILAFWLFLIELSRSYKSNLILIIHDCSERNHPCSRVLSIIYIRKSLFDSSKLYFSFFRSFAEVKTFWTVLLNTFTAPWFLNYKVLNIYSIISFRFTNFQNIVFELTSFISLISIWNIMCNDAIFRC